MNSVCRWRYPVNRNLVFFVINDEVNSETGFGLMNLMVGSMNRLYNTLADKGLRS